jgi:hypothetical protein
MSLVLENHPTGIDILAKLDFLREDLSHPQPYVACLSDIGGVVLPLRQELEKALADHFLGVANNDT